MAEQERNPRTLVMQRLRKIGRSYRFLTGNSRWGQSQTVPDHDPVAKRTSWRKRRPDERIENNLHAWFELRAEIANMVDELVALDEVAVQQAERLRALQRTRETAGV